MLTLTDLRRLESKIETLVSHVERREHPTEHILKELRIMSKSLDDLTSEVAAVKSVNAAALSLINGFGARLDSAIAAAKAGDDSAALDALSADLKASADPLAVAIAANTPAASLADASTPPVVMPTPSTPPAG